MSMHGWMPIETAPHSVNVLVAYRNPLGKWRRVIAFYVREETVPMEDEEAEEDEFAPAGWYEYSDNREDIVRTFAEPIYWQPLPSMPEV